ncbi:MAG: fold hydrolase [Flavipsychrobacter sp.]|nr:fold hydrolase [Flavipsychrobacter sp.]
MLNVVFFTVNPFEENTYLITNEQDQCWIVDPGMYSPQETAQMISYITENGLTPQAIINTHAHIDHILGVQALTDKYKLPFGIHKHELPVLERAADTAAMFGFELKNVPKATFYINENEQLKLGTDALDVFYTPGHSPGSISFYYPEGNWVISGDVLFSGSIGRTDLPGGNFDTLIQSIRSRLLVLPDETTVLSGHGPVTSIGEEKKHNPFLK